MMMILSLVSIFSFNFMIFMMLTPSMSGFVTMLGLDLLSKKIYVESLLDVTSVYFSVTVLVIFSSIIIFSYSYLASDKSFKRFMLVLFLFVLSMIMLIWFFTPPLTILGWDGLGLTSFILVMYFASKTSLSSSLVTVLMNRLGDGFIIILMLMFLNCQMIQGPEFFKDLFLLILLLAAITKSAQVPFCVWLPAAMAAPTPVSALVHSSTLVTAGIFLIIRFIKFDQSIWFVVIIFMLGLLTSFLASLSALAESDTKKIVALSTLSQLGFMMISISLGFEMLCLFHLLMHALFKATLFISVGEMIHLTSTQKEFFYSNMSQLGTYSFMVCKLCLLVMSGLMFFCGFFSKDFMLEMTGSVTMSFLSNLMMLASILFTILYSYKMLMNLSEGELTYNIVLSEKNKLILGSSVGLIMCIFMMGSWIFSSNQSLMMMLTLPLEEKLFPLVSLIILMIMTMKFPYSLIFLKNITNMSGLVDISTQEFLHSKFKIWSLLAKLDLGWLDWILTDNMSKLYNIWLKRFNIILEKNWYTFVLMSLLVTLVLLVSMYNFNKKLNLSMN